MRKIAAIITCAVMLALSCTACAEVLTENWRYASDEELIAAEEEINAELQHRRSGTLTERLRQFFYYWNGNNPEDQLSLCPPSWRNEVKDPKAALSLLTNDRIPVDMMVESISGSEEDASRTVTLLSTMKLKNGEGYLRYRMRVVVLREDEGWYVYPPSLHNYEAVEEQEPDAETTAPEPAASPEPTATPAAEPAETPGTDPDTVLYYHPEGGAYYHLDPNCRRVKERYLPLQGTFTYAEVNREPYSQLQPCSVCGAPERE